MKRRTTFILLLVLGLALMSCDWASPLRSFLQATPAPVAAPIAIPAEATTKAVPHAEEGMAADVESLTPPYQQVSLSLVPIRVAQKVERGIASPHSDGCGSASFPAVSDLSGADRFQVRLPWVNQYPNPGE